MKLISLNTHSLVEKNWEQKCRQFVSEASRQGAGVIAMQEVNQTHTALALDNEVIRQTGYVSCKEDCVIREDNYIFQFASEWKKENSGKDCYWTWLPMKLGYSKYDEGLAIFSVYPILKTKIAYITSKQDYNDWKTRMILGALIEAEGEKQWVYSVHTGWWDDEVDPFAVQWQRIEQEVKSEEEDLVWIMGDFNNPAHIRGEGYDYVKQAGWFDCYELSEQKDEGITVAENIDGWKEREAVTGMRIDFIWCSKQYEVKQSQVIMNGKGTPIVSDHFGTIITTK